MRWKRNGKEETGIIGFIGCTIGVTTTVKCLGFRVQHLNIFVCRCRQYHACPDEPIDALAFEE